MIVGIFIVIMLIIFLYTLFSGGSSSSDTPAKRNNTVQKRNTNVNYRNSNSEDFFCEESYFGDACEECGDYDVNQGWIGENY